MPTVQEAAEGFVRDLQSQNIAGVMAVLLPEAMIKVMAMQGRLQARAAEAMAAGRTPAPMSGYSMQMLGPEGDDEAVQITLESADGTAEVMTRWREVEGAWKVVDLGLTGARD